MEARLGIWGSVVVETLISIKQIDMRLCLFSFRQGRRRDTFLAEDPRKASAQVPPAAKRARLMLCQ